tara:strand:+ start:241 stop:402 length:162 start_codon:yes stop_codon:yes gene_type:complete
MNKTSTPLLLIQYLYKELDHMTAELLECQLEIDKDLKKEKEDFERVMRFLNMN